MRKALLSGLLVVVLLAACNRSLRPAPARAPTVPPAPVPGMPTSPPVLITPVPSGSPEPANPTVEPTIPPSPGPSVTATPQPATPDVGLVGATTIPGATAVEPHQVITITLPPAGAPLASGALVAGYVSRVPDAKALAYRVYTSDGRVIGRGSLVVNGVPGQTGDYAGAARFAAPARPAVGQLEVWEPNPEDGSVLSNAWINVGFGRGLTPDTNQAPAITIEWPLPGAALAPGDEALGGISSLPAENRLGYRVYDQAGHLVGSGPVRVEPEAGHGSFAAPVNYVVEAPGPGRILIVDQSPEDGRWLAAAFSNVLLAPGTPAPSEATPATAPAGQAQPHGGLPLPTEPPATPTPPR